MTIKKIASSQTKRVPPDGDKKEAHGPNESSPHQHSPGIGLGHRSGDGHGQVNSKRRSEVYDEMTRQRRSPQKTSVRPIRKREILGSVSNNCNNAGSPNAHCMTGSSVSSVSSTTGSLSSASDTSSAASALAANNTTNNNQKATDNESGKSEAQAAKAELEDICSGYNSGDEHYQAKGPIVSPAEWLKRDKKFEKMMKERGFELRNVEEDGACLFRAISLQIYGDEEMHDVIRQHTMDYVYKNREYYCHFVTEDINGYIKRKRRNDSHGNHIEIQAISEIYGRPIEVYCYGPDPINIFNSEGVCNGYSPLRLSYQHGSHYNALIDPYNATVGEGLGLAGYKPDMQAKEAAKLSEQLAIEQTMFEDKLKTTDWEATNEAIEEQVARESYLQWCRENSQKSRSSAKVISATITSAQAQAQAQANSGLEASASMIGGPSLYGDLGLSAARLPGMRSSPITSTITRANELQGPSETATAASALAAACPSAGGGGGGDGDKTSASDLLAVTQNMYVNLANAKKLNFGVAAASGLGVAGDGSNDSDDTDRSSNSSQGSGGSPGKRRVSKRNGTKRRIETTAAMPTPRPVELNVFSSTVSEAKLSKSELLGDGLESDDAAEQGSPTAEPRPCSSKQVEEPKEAGDSASSKETAEEAEASSAAEATPFSTFYHDLLETAYAPDGNDPLSESEMLQRAIQMSTQDYINEQNRKYLGN